MMTSYTKKNTSANSEWTALGLVSGFQVPLLNSKHVNGTSYRKWHLSLAQQGAMVGWSCNVIGCHWKQIENNLLSGWWLTYFFHLTWGDDQIHGRYWNFLCWANLSCWMGKSFGKWSILQDISRMNWNWTFRCKSCTQVFFSQPPPEKRRNTYCSTSGDEDDSLFFRGVPRWSRDFSGLR